MERKLIIDIIKGVEPKIPVGINPSRLQDISIEEGVAGPVFLCLKQSGISSSEYPLLEKAYNVNIALNAKHLEKLERLEDALEKAKIEVMTLKGASLLDNVYTNIALRPMDDIDLMLHPSDRKNFEDVLTRLGYERDKMRAHLFVKDDTPIDIHVHALNTDRIVSRNSLFPIGMAPVWQNARPLRNGFKWVKRPDDRDNVILLFLHMMKHSFERLFWWMDIILLLNRYDSETWSGLRERSEYLKTDRAVRHMLYLLDIIFDITPPSESGFRDVKKCLTCFEKRLLKETAGGRSGHETGVLMGLFCIKGVAEKILFVRESLFPGREVIEKEFGWCNSGRRFLFYTSRLLRALLLLSRKLLAMSCSFFRTKP